MLTSVQDLKAIQSRVQQTLERGVQIDLSTEPCRRYLRRHANRKIAVVILYADIDGSTRMSMSIPPADFARILHVFSQEMTLAVSECGGYTLKYVGDAIIALFPAQFDKKQASKSAIDCARLMHDIVKNGINPPLKSRGLPELGIKISADYGDVQVVLYGKSLERSHIDIVGASISAAAKMIAFAPSGSIVVGEGIRRNLSDGPAEDRFERLEADTSKWSLAEEGKGYPLFVLRG